MFAWSETETTVVCIAVVIIVAIVLGRELSGKLGSMAVSLGAIDRAVNQREQGAPTLSDDVMVIRADMARLHETLEAVAERVLALESHITSEDTEP